MKIFQKIAVLLSLTVGFASCHGTSDEGDVKVTLTPSATTIVADGEQEVTFSVQWGANTVTPEARVYLVSHSDVEWDGVTFRTEEAGEYTFQAIYNDNASEEVVVTATEPVGEHISRFDRHVCIMELTGAWCSNCPEGYRSLKGLLAAPGRKGKVHVMALHDGTGGADPMALPQTNIIDSYFKIGAFPGFVTDMRDAGLLSADGIMNLVPSIDTSFDEYPAHCDVKVATVLTDSELSVDVTLFAELAGSYAVSAWLLEDGVVGPQLDGSIQYDEWNHEHVVRKLLNENWKGDDMGTMSAEGEKTKSYTCTISAEWNVENLSIMALAIDANGYVNNVAVCPVGENVDYKYID